MALGPAPVLAVLVGAFHTALFVFIRGRVGVQTIVVLAAAILGAWAGDAVGGRLNIDPVRVGDFRLVSASIVAWMGIVFASVTAVLGTANPE